MERKEDIKVFISTRDSIFDECKEDLGRGAWITLMQHKKGAVFVHHNTV